MQLRILAVDDERETVEVFQRAVEPLGYEVVALSDSREAAQRIMKEKFDFIALGAHMPHLDGFELAERIRASPSNQAVPILMFTGSDSGETMRRGFAVGVTFYMGKPLDAEKLRGLFAVARGVMVQQRRRYVRLAIRVEVECEVGGKRFQTRSLDLAQGGILLELSGDLAESENVEVKFALPGVREPLQLTGRVARKVPPKGVALEFVEPEQLERAALQLFVMNKTIE